ncbi:MAG: hypothetical protein AB9897_01150 [Anaerolineaceae bacterium]
MTKPIAADVEEKKPTLEIVTVALSGSVPKNITWQMYPLSETRTLERAIEHYEAKFKVPVPARAWQWLYYLYIPVPGQEKLLEQE